jgi:HEAT repeat protein
MYLPKDIRSIQVENGKVVDKKIVISTEQIMELVNKGENDEVARMAEQREALALSSNKTDRNRELEKLRNQVRAGDANVRMIVVRTLSKDRNLDNVPALIFALSDPAPAVATQADRGLRFISRKVNGVGLPAAEPTKAEIQLAERAWKAWYLSIRPNAELLD